MSSPSKSRGQPQPGSGLPVALVLGGIELVRPLVLAGIRCQVVSGPKDATRFSRHAATVFALDWSEPVSHHGPELVERLVEYAAQQSQPPVLFYYWDEPLLFVSRHRDELAKAFRFVLADPALVEALVDKAQFWALATARSLPVPATAILTPASEPSPPDLRHLGFPLILKPFRRDRTWDAVEQAHGGKAIRVDRPEQLRAIWPRLAGLEGNIIAQRYVDGPESSIESYHVYVDVRGEIAGEFTGRKIRTLPPSHGHTTALTITDAPDIARLGRELVRLLDLRGVAKFDFKRGPDGEPYLLEVNPRFSLWHHPGARAGVNIPALVYADLAGRARPAVQARSGVRWCHPKDFLAARQAGVPLTRWAWWAATCEAKAFWSWEDPLPFVGTAAGQLLGRRG
jgi:D-aspartate ligase